MKENVLELINHLIKVCNYRKENRFFCKAYFLKNRIYCYCKKLYKKMNLESKIYKIYEPILSHFSLSLIPLSLENMMEYGRDKCQVSASFAAVPVGNYMFKVNSRNTGARCEICSKLTIKMSEGRQ